MNAILELLRARKKLEGSKTVYRCGVLPCPEVLATEIENQGLRLTRGYAPNTKGIFIKTRRSATRIKHQRDFVESCVKMNEQMGSHDYKAARRVRDDLWGFEPDLDDFPLIICCGRCGRSSKIEE